MRLYELRGPSDFTKLKSLFQKFENMSGRQSKVIRHNALLDLEDLLINDPDSKNNFKILGKGSFSIVFRPSKREYVVKVWIQDTSYDQVIKIIKDNQKDIHLPKIKWGPKLLFMTKGGTKIQCVVMEPLFKITRKQYNTINSLSSIIGPIGLSGLKTLIKKIKLNRDNDSEELVNDKIKLLTEIYPTLKKFNGIRDAWDLHPMNYMRRADDTIVLIDPKYDPGAIY